MLSAKKMFANKIHARIVERIATMNLSKMIANNLLS